MKDSRLIRGRGAQADVSNRFSALEHELREDFLEYCARSGEDAPSSETVFINTYPKTVINRVKSPDIGLEYSLNPYQGCEHGCVYCYARNSHEYWGYNAGLDFERKVLVKQNAAALLEEKLKSRHWKANPIVLSGNTDCYQPVERKLRKTRELLAVFLKYKHPVGIITKNALILRDLDLLSELAQDRLVRVNISITTLDERIRAILEPRTSTIKKRLETVEVLSEAGIPVHVMMAPIIPGINSHEILSLVKEVSKRGAYGVGYTMVRLNGAIGQIFSDWIKSAMPDRAEKVLHQIAACHGGQLNDSRFGTRMKGEGVFSEQVAQQFELARKRFFPKQERVELNTELYSKRKDLQLKLFN